MPWSPFGVGSSLCVVCFFYFCYLFSMCCVVVFFGVHYCYLFLGFHFGICDLCLILFFVIDVFGLCFVHWSCFCALSLGVFFGRRLCFVSLCLLLILLCCVVARCSCVL